jgi:hypothetical protein
VKLFYYLYFAPRGFYLHSILPIKHTPEDDDLTLRIFRSTLIFMTYYNAFDYLRLFLMLAGIIYCHLTLKRSARLHAARVVEAGGRESMDTQPPYFRGGTQLHRFLG